MSLAIIEIYRGVRIVRIPSGFAYVRPAGKNQPQTTVVCNSVSEARGLIDQDRLERTLQICWQHR